jgi:large subunit ribosomal protein L6
MMSRVGKYPVSIPDGVTIQIANDEITAKGKLGELSAPISAEVDVVYEDNVVKVTPKRESKKARSMWGTTRALVSNLVTGVSTGFTVNLEINGVGYRAAVEGSDLVLALGFSHPVRFPIPDGITMKCERPTAISISGSDKQRVGQLAAEIRAFRPPEPFKGKGVKYANEIILRKEGKKK